MLANYLELNSEGCITFKGKKQKEKESRCLAFMSSTKREKCIFTS